MLEDGQTIFKKYTFTNPFIASKIKALGADEQAIGKRIVEELGVDGQIATPERIVEDAKSENSPMNCIIFEDSDDVAAYKHRIQIARQLVNSVSWEIVTPKETENGVVQEVTIVKAMTHISGQEGYQQTAYVYQDPVKLDQHIQDAIMYLRQFQKKYNDILQLKSFMKEVDNIIEELKQV